MKSRIGIAFAMFFLSLSSSFAGSPSSDAFLTTFLSEFKKNPKLAMNQLPPKFDSRGHRIWNETVFDELQVSGNRFIDVKDRERTKILGRHSAYLEAALGGGNDLARFFRPGFKIEKNINEVSNYGSGKNPVVPWSGDYWATYRLGASARYADANYPQENSFSEYRAAYAKYQPIDFSNSEVMDILSPAEKYDILTGDEKFSLTRYGFDNSSAAVDPGTDSIESWFGICHGWAPASFMLPRPRAAVTIPVENFMGHAFSLTFYPDDVKALATLLWANAPSRTRVLGTRCNEKEPEIDETGRITSGACFDINPGAWHLLVANQLGKLKRSFVLDAIYDYEVWNHPAHSYLVSYFDPRTNAVSEKMSDAMIPIETFSADHFKAHRDERTRFVVGVSMELNYQVETRANHDLSDSESFDTTKTVQYVYDLELDAGGMIIGGEWYQNAHPDFVWAPDAGSQAAAPGENRLTGVWTENGAMPSSWKSIALPAAEAGQPLGAVVEGLLKRANAAP